MKRILFLSTANLAANPRLTKELRLAIAQGFAATVIQFELGNWSDAKTAELEKEFAGVAFTRLSALRRPFFPWFFSSVLEKLFRWLPGWMLTDFMVGVTVSKRSLLLLRAVKRINGSFDWVIAHNPGAFYPAYYFARDKGVKLGIDVEDYHPGETTNRQLASITIRLMRRVLPVAAYCSYASSLIAQAVQEDLPTLKNKQLVLLNGFSGEEFTEPVLTSKEALQLVWFSQNINSGRGLESFIPLVNRFSPAVTLHIIGELNKEFAEQYLQNRNGIIIHSPMTQKALHHFLSTCAIGIAPDIPVNKNREVALTNKILSFAQAGLFIVASHTPAQDQFLSNSQLDYLQTDLSTADLRKTFEQLLSQKETIRKRSRERYLKGRVYDWEVLSQPLLEVWRD